MLFPKQKQQQKKCAPYGANCVYFWSRQPPPPGSPDLANQSQSDILKAPAGGGGLFICWFFGLFTILAGLVFHGSLNVAEFVNSLFHLVSDVLLLGLLWEIQWQITFDILQDFVFFLPRNYFWCESYIVTTQTFNQKIKVEISPHFKIWFFFIFSNIRIKLKIVSSEIILPHLDLISTLNLPSTLTLRKLFICKWILSQFLSHKRYFLCVVLMFICRLKLGPRWPDSHRFRVFGG